MPFDSTLFNTNPYYDDYDASKKFLRTLFRPGFAVQARELTQSQTILQNQIESFGNHIFKDGSIVAESQVVLNNGKFVRVANLTGYSGVSIDDFSGLTAAVAGKNTIKIVDVLGALTGSSVDTANVFFFSEYMAGPTGFAVGDILSANYNGTTIYASVTGGTSTFDAGPTFAPAVGSASLVGIDSGIRYIKGFFVGHDRQTVVPYNVTGSGSNTYRQFNTLNSTVKLAVTDTIITENDDETLNDPAFGSYNYAAPGAHRYRIDLTLDHEPLSLTADYALINIVDGEASFKSNYPEYSVLADTLARRTYDESGNYTVSDFSISVEDHPTDDTKLRVRIGNGKAYIFGQEFVNATNTVLDVDKARTLMDASASVPIVIGNTINLRWNPALTTSSLTGIDFNTGPKLLISTGATGAYAGIGSLRLQGLNVFDGTFVGNAYDVTMIGTTGFTAAKRLFIPGITGSDKHILEFTDSAPSIRYPTYGSLVFPLTNEINSYAVDSDFGPYQMYFTKSCTATLNGGANDFYVDTNFGLPNLAGFVEFQDLNNFKAYTLTGASITSSSIAFGAGDARHIIFTSASTAQAVVFAKFSIVTGKLGSGEIFKRAKSSSTKTAAVTMRDDGYEQYAYLNGDVDVYRIESITGQYTGSGGVTAITDRFTLDDGQRDSIYDWSRIVVKPQYYGTGITGVYVRYKKFDRVTGTVSPAAYGDGPFTKDSYKGLTYTDIPVYASSERSGRPFSLAGAFDFRPDRKTPASFTGSDEPYNYGTVSTMFPSDVSIDNVEWQYYSPRTDKIVLGKDKSFRVITGTEMDQAPAPPDAADAMTLASIFFYPYTKSKNDIVSSFVKNSRYTMKDIGKLEKRIDRLEYYTTLSLAEKSARDLEITDVNGLNRFKNGIFVDNCESRTNADYFNSETLCAVDPEAQEIRPRFQTQYINYGLTACSGCTATSDGIILLDYTESTMIDQKLASKAISVNPFNVSNYQGTIEMVPASDDWVDTTTRPAVQTNLQGENDGISDVETVDFGTVWNNWETQWTGKLTGLTDWKTTKSKKHSVVDPTDGRLKQKVTRERLALQEQSQTRNGERITLQSETVTRNVGERVVDVSVIPYMRANTISMTAKGLRPNVRVYPFFDGVDVSSYVSPTTLIPNSEGTLSFTFSLPSGIFKTGERLFRLIDDANDVVANATSCAEKIYRAQGLLKTEEGIIVSTRSVNIKREAVSEDRVFNNVVTDTVVKYVDPVAQTFLIDPLVYPNGVCLSSVDLFFKGKSSTLPVNIQIRPTVNGYPSSSTIIPFSEVYKSPSAVSVSDDGQTPTAFTFSTPVYLAPGEYALTVLSNSDDYTVWVSEVGQNEIVSGLPITSQPYPGSLFKSQNSSTWTAEQAMDLKFKIKRCVFSETEATVEYVYNETSDNIPAALTNYCGVTVYRPNWTAITPAATTLSAKSQVDAGTQFTVQNNQNYVLPIKTAIVAGDPFTLTLTISSTNDAVSPMIDSERVSGLYIFNIIKKVTDIYKDQYEQRYSTKGLTDSSKLTDFRYITKRVNLQEGFESDNIDVYFAARLPYDSDLRVYVKTQSPNDNTSFDKIPYEKMVIHPDYAIPYGSATGSAQYVSTSDDDYVDLRFTRGPSSAYMTSGITGQSTFHSFQIKVVGYGSNSYSVVPSIKGIKAIAT